MAWQDERQGKQSGSCGTTSDEKEWCEDEEKWVRQEILKGEGLVRYEKCRESKAQVPHMATRGMVRPLDLV